MSTSTTPQANTSRPPGSLVPPEEQFWTRYSPHSEAPLSFAASVALHGLAIGTIVLFAVYLAAIFFGPERSLPVEAVRLQIPGGGGGKPTGVGTGKGIGHGGEDVTSRDDNETLPGEDEPRRPVLKEIEKKHVQEKFDPASARYIQESSSETAKSFARLEDSVRRKLADGLRPAGKGKGGPGKDGGKGTGTGTGEGSGTGAGKATLTQREKRMLRWHMRFTANSGAEYLNQLRGLGAILAIPVREDPEPQYKIIHNKDVRAGVGMAALHDEDLSKIQRIYWIDDKPNSVRDVIAALGLNLRPSRFVAFMPQKLEDRLFEMERSYIKNVLRASYNEDRIDETHFDVYRSGGGYSTQVRSVTLRR